LKKGDEDIGATGRVRELGRKLCNVKFYNLHFPQNILREDSMMNFEV
jgi:hypothetical protein